MFNATLALWSTRLQLVHPDFIYFLKLIEDFSWFTVIILMKSKTNITDAIKDYAAAVENRFGRKPVSIRSDNEEEYVSKAQEELEQQFTVAYMP